MLGKVVGEILAGTARRKQRKHERNLAEETYQRDIDMWKRQNQQDIKFWNMQNQYNLPSKQMERLREAGLNPNLIYGSGSQGGSAERITSAETPKYSQSRPEYAVGDIDINPLQELSLFAQIQNTKAQTDLVNERKLTEVAARPRVTADSKLRTELSRYAAEMAHNTMLKEAAQADKEYMSMKELKETWGARVGQKKAEAAIKEFDASIAKKEGLRPQDPAYVRYLVQFFNWLFGDIHKK